MSYLSEKIKVFIRQDGVDLAAGAYQRILDEMLSEGVDQRLVASFLTAQAMRQITAPALVGGVKAMRAHGRCPTIGQGWRGRIVDTCGTGGDYLNTFSVSTGAGLLAAACDVAIAKHGNRSASSRAGSADCAEALGLLMPREREAIERSLGETHFVFLFAPFFYPALQNLAPLRKALGFRTWLNALGPLLNPLRARRQVLGVAEKALLQPMAKALQALGTQYAWVVRGQDGMDEISLCAPTEVVMVKRDSLRTVRVDARDLGIKRCRPQDLEVKGVAENAKCIEDILMGREKGPKREMVVLNCASVLVVAGRVSSLKRGIALAREVLDRGKGVAVLQRLRARKERAR